jgi:hypothetical protein
VIVLDTVPPAAGEWVLNTWSKSLNVTGDGVATVTVDSSERRRHDSVGAIRFDLFSDGSTETYRSELSGSGGAVAPIGTNREIQRGQDFWFTFSVKSGVGTRIGSATDELIMQLHATSSAWGFTNPSFCLYVRKGQFCIGQRYDETLDSATSGTIKIIVDRPFAPCVAGEWHDFVIRLIPNFTTGSLTQVWKDDRLIYESSAPNSYNQTGMTHYLKFGCYMSSWRSVPPTVGAGLDRRTWFFDAVRVGDASSVFTDFTLPAKRSVFGDGILFVR